MNSHICKSTGENFHLLLSRKEWRWKIVGKCAISFLNKVKYLVARLVSIMYETIVDKAKAVAQLIIWNDTLVSAQINATYSMLCSP